MEDGFKSHRAKPFVWAAAILVVGVLSYGGWNAFHRWLDVDGIYVTHGGAGYLVLSRAAFGRLQITKTAADEYWEWEARRSGFRLILEGYYTRQIAQQLGMADDSLATPILVLVLKRSKGDRDDWDLVARSEDQYRTQHAYPMPEKLAERVPYLHKLGDRQVIECLDFARAEMYGEALEAAKALLETHPNDCHARMMYLFASAAADKVEEVDRRLKEWREGLAKGDPQLERSIRKIDYWLYAQHLSAAGKNAYGPFQIAFHNNKTLEELVLFLPQIAEFESYASTELLWPEYKSYQFTEGQVVAKVLRTIAVFRMLEGKWDEAREIVVGVSRISRLLTEDRRLVPVLVGVAVKNIGSEGLEIYALNCCETEDEFKRFWTDLDSLNNGRPEWKIEDAIGLAEFYNKDDGRYLPSLNEVVSRFRTAESRFQLVRMATAARHRLVSHGEFPKEADEFGPLLPNGPPRDPFSPGPLRFRPGVIWNSCYSVGPDRQDNSAAIEYDPTNGTISAGDIVLRVPRKRRYPFPPEGVRATSVEDLKRQFPNGLPHDLFASNKGRGLSPAVAVDGQVFVWSYGPDVDEYRGENPLAFNPTVATGTLFRKSEITTGHTTHPHRLEIHYDPTNGTVSEGDLYIPIPRR